MAWRDFKSKLGRVIASQAGTLRGELEARIRVEVDKYVEKLLQECPPPETLRTLSIISNQLKLNVGLFEKRIEKWNKTAKTLEPLLIAADLVLVLLKRDPTPLVVTITPVAGAPLITPQKMAKISRRASRIRKLEKFVSDTADDIDTIQALTESALLTLGPIQAKIQRLDNLIERCATGNEATVQEIQPPIKEDPSEEYVAENGKIYTITVITVPDTFDRAPRRQAIAKNQQGIVVLTGPASFSSSVQILKEELKFRIDKQLL